jgi:hypothetical protein
MLQKLTRLVGSIASPRVLVLLILLATLCPVVLFPAAGIGDSRPLDLYFSYSPDQAHEYLGELGAKGRGAYAEMGLTTDLLFPVVYSLALIVALMMAARSVLPADSRLQYLCFFPVLVVIADWGENLSLAIVIRAFPDRVDVVATAASLFTSLKWTFLMLVVMTLVTAVALVVTRQLRGRFARHG